MVSLVSLMLVACSQSSEPEGELAPEAALVEKKQVASKAARKAPRASSARKKAEAEAIRAAVAPATTSETAAQEPLPSYQPAPVAPAPRAGKRIARVNGTGPCVAVTFDDGPSALYTPRVLDIFKRHGAHATFFVQGQNANRHRGLLARMVAEGHEVASHTWSHINMRASSRDTIIRELDRTAAVIEQATGSRPKVMRPPYGAVNSSLVNMVYARYGTPAILWDVDTNDWRKPGVSAVIQRAVNNARPGSIILLHDIHASTIAAVEGIVTGLQARGFKLVTVSELISLQGRGAATPEPASAPAEEPAAEMPAGAPATELHGVVTQQQLQPQTLPCADFCSAGSESIGGASPAVALPVPEAPASPAQPAASAEAGQGEAYLPAAPAESSAVLKEPF